MNNLFQMQLCRLCLLEKNSYSSIYEANECYGFLIADAINELLELDVSPGDGLPDNVCRDCLEEVARFKRFKNVCHEAKYTYKYLNVQHNALLMNIKVEPKEDDLFEAVENEINPLHHIKSEPLEEEECQAKVVNVYSITPAEYERHGSSYILSDQRNNYVPRKLNSTYVGDGVKYLLQHQVSAGDGFPERICHDCLNEMARFKRFKNLCQEAKLTLKYIIALATGAMPPPTSLPSFLNAAHGSTADAKKGTSAASSSTLQVCTTSSLGSSEPLISPNIPSSSAAPSISAIPSSSAIPASSSETVSSCAQVNLEDGDGSSTANGNYDTCHITPPPSQLSGNQVDNEQQTVSFADGQEDSDIENLCDEPLPVETVLSEPDTEVDHGNRSVEEGIAAISQNGEREDSFGMFPISSIINDLHQFSSYIPPGTRLEHSIFDKQKEPEVVDLVDDDEDEDGIRRSVFPFAQTLVSSCNESGSSRPESDSSVIIKTEGNEDSDLENMCEHPLPVETVLSEPDGEMGSASGGVKCENSQNESESRDDSFGLFSLTSTFGDLMTSAVGEGNGCLPRNQHPIVHSGQPSQNNSSDAVARPLENPNKYPFWCHICGKNFMRKDKLKQHSVVHSNERPFICRICGCSYKRKDKLTSHVTSSHLQHLPHQCDICGKRFVRKDKLKQHSVVHSNRRPYVCKVCSKKYKSKIELKKHEKRAHAQVQPL